jgi:broad specificity phosphatase PhoE
MDIEGAQRVRPEPPPPRGSPCRVLVGAAPEGRRALPDALAGVEIDTVFTPPSDLDRALAEAVELVRRAQDRTILCDVSPSLAAALVAQFTGIPRTRVTVIPGGISFLEVGPDGCGVLHLHNWGVQAAALLDVAARESCRVFLVRHGQSMVVEAGGQVWSHHPIGLTPHGRAQAARAGRQLRDAPLSAIYTSDLTRAVDTAEAIAGPHGLAPIVDESLREVGLGEFEGMTLARVRELGDARFIPWLDVTFNQAFPGQDFHHPADLSFPDGESILSVHTRARAGFGRLAATHQGETIAVVSHTWVIQPLLAHLTGGDPRRYYAFGMRYATMSLASVGSEGRGSLVALNADLDLAEVAGGRLSKAAEEE